VWILQAAIATHTVLITLRVGMSLLTYSFKLQIPSRCC
jgi:hypothetical protein